MGTVIKILLFFLIFTVIVVCHEGGHCLIGKKSGIGVKEFAIGLGPTLIGFTKGGTKYSIKALPFGGICIFEGDDGDEASEGSFRNAGVWQRIATVAAGPMMNFVLAFVLSVFVIASIGVDTPVLSSVMQGFPAEKAGLLAGDEIVSIAGRRISVYRDITLWTMVHEGEPAEVVYRRDGELHSTVITPEYYEEAGRFLFGFTGPMEYVKMNPLQVLRYSAVEVRYWIEVTIKSLGMLGRGKYSVNDLAGPVGVAQIVGEVYEDSKSDGAYYVWLNMLNLTVLLTADLGVMNLLPLPALDGGRLLFLLIEAVTRKRPSARTEGIITLIGASFLVMLMVFVMVNDIMRLVR